MELFSLYSTRVGGQSITSLNMAFQNVLTDVRDSYINDDRSCSKALVLIGVEVGLILNIPVGIIEIIARTILAVLFWPCRTNMTDNISWVGAIISTSYLINNVLALIRGLNFNQKIENGRQLREYLPCLLDYNIWAQSNTREYSRDSRIPR